MNNLFITLRSTISKMVFSISMILFSGFTFAAPMDAINLSKAQAKERVGRLFAEWESKRMEAAVSLQASSAQLMEQEQIRTIKNILKRSRLFEMMLALENETPTVAKQLTTVSLLYEMKSLNQSLSQQLTEMKKTNQLMQQLVMIHTNTKNSGLGGLEEQ